jgi:hypothetical protein
MRTLYQSMSSTTANDLHSVSIFDLSEEELRERLRPTSEKIKQEAFAKNSYLTYYDPLVCRDTSYEYRDRKELVKLENGKAHLVKIL